MVKEGAGKREERDSTCGCRNAVLEGKAGQAGAGQEEAQSGGVWKPGQGLSKGLQGVLSNPSVRAQDQRSGLMGHEATVSATSCSESGSFTFFLFYILKCKNHF